MPFPLDEIDSLDELAECLSKYHKQPEAVQTFREMLGKHFLFGYKNCTERGKGFCYAIHTQGGYFVDGCNDGVPLFHAASAGRLVKEKLFNEYSAEVIFCAYPTEDTRAHRLCKRVGFKECMKKGDLTIFSMQRG